MAFSGFTNLSTKLGQDQGLSLMSERLLSCSLFLIISTAGIFLPLCWVMAGEFNQELKTGPALIFRTPDPVLKGKVSSKLAPWAQAHDVKSIHPFREILLKSKNDNGSWEKLTILKLWGQAGINGFFNKRGFSVRNWRFLRRYPRQYVVHELGLGENIHIDGRLDDPAWVRASWTKGGFVDITHHLNRRLNRVPRMFQARAKLRWDKDYLYVGAELHEPVIYGHITGHNSPNGPPYLDNDFEVFIDVSGMTEYFKEYEMNVLNATYDVIWGVPAFAGLVCDKSENHSAIPYAPVCKNSTFFQNPPDNWTMVGGSTGLRSATAFDVTSFAQYIPGRSVWTLEIAFPIHGNADHGGLLDALGPFPASQSNFDQFDPSHGDAGPGRPRYWYFDLARAEHPRPYQIGVDTIYCPLGCSDSLAGMIPSFQQLNEVECDQVEKLWPTLLGDEPYDCYWEWVWQDLGPEIYMHRPQSWAVLQFAGAKSEATKLCKNIEFPGRHIAKQVNAAQAEFFKLNNAYAAQPTQLLSPQVCWPPTCLIGDLAYALSQPEIFTVDIMVEEDATVLSPACTARPCYQASVHVVVPRTAGYAYTVNITNNRLITVEHHDVPGEKAPCL